MSPLIEASEVSAIKDAVIIDCRFSLADVGEGEALYRNGHIAGALYLHLERDMSSAVKAHGGRHPLPDASRFVELLASLGVGPQTQVIAYDDSRLAFAARLWWMMKSLGFRVPVLLNGGYKSWLEAGGEVETAVPSRPELGNQGEYVVDAAFGNHCDINGLRIAQAAGSTLVDSREEGRYLGREEPIDPIAGHIPGALNRPWQGVTDSAGKVLPEPVQREHWGELMEAEQLVVYCGSGVTACVNLFSLASLGRDDALLYVGSWSDWCSYMQAE